MPFLPIPQTWWQLFWTLFRVASTIGFIYVVWYGARSLSKHNSTVEAMLTQIQHDRLERDTLLGSLQRAAAELSEKTAEINRKVQERDEDLRTKMVENTEITRAAASAAKDAFHEANSVNQKIARTNEHIERMTHGPSASVAAVAEHLEHIDQNTATIAENTKKKTDAGEC